MKIISVPRINALGKTGPEKMGEKVLATVGADFEEIEIDNFNVESSERVIYSKAKEIFCGGELQVPRTFSEKKSCPAHPNCRSVASKSCNSLKETREEKSERNNKVCFVGGDHSITYPIFKAFSEVNKNVFLIVFDAHADCDYASKEPTHEEWLRAVIERDIVKPENVILIGVRKMWDVEKKFLEEKGVKVFSPREDPAGPGEIYDLEAVADYVTERAKGMDVYVSVDIDVLDSAFAPAVNCPEPNGLTSRELFYLLKRIFCIKSLKALDVVEVVPKKDEKYDYRTVKVATKIVEEFLQTEQSMK